MREQGNCRLIFVLMHESGKVIRLIFRPGQGSCSLAASVDLFCTYVNQFIGMDHRSQDLKTLAE